MERLCESGASTAASAIPFQCDAAAVDPWRVVLALAACLMLLGGLALWQRGRQRHGGAAGSRDAEPSTGQGLAVRERVRLSAKAQLVVIEFDQARLLVSHGEHGVTVLARTPE